MSAPLVEVRDDAVVTLTLNMPEMRNPISDDAVLEALIEALTRLDGDDSVRVIILTGAGSAFSSGGNLRKMGAHGGLNDPLPARTRMNYRRGIQRLPLVLEAMEVPTIAAVNGPAIGAGCDLACMCDLRIAAESACFAESFVKVGIAPGDGGAWFLPRVVGFSKASEMTLTGDPIDATEALACGLVSRVVPDNELMDAAHALARRVAANPPHAVRMTRRLLRQGRNAELAAALDAAAAMQAVAHATQDHREAVAALLERRSGTFTGQ